MPAQRPGVSIPRVTLPVVLIGGFVGLLLVAVSGVMVLGFATARQSTTRLLAEQADAIIRTVVLAFERKLEPIENQGRYLQRWSEAREQGFTSIEGLDAFMLGAFAATPALHASTIVGADLRGRRYRRSSPEVERIDLTGDPAAKAALLNAEKDSRPAWGAPAWIDADGIAATYLRVPLFHAGKFLGAVFQTIDIRDLSRPLASLANEYEMTPFVLYDSHWVLAHPAMLVVASGGSDSEPLPELDTFADGILGSLWEAEHAPLRFLPQTAKTRGSMVTIGGTRYVFLYRKVERFSDKPLMFGVYFPEADLEGTALGRFWRSVVFAIGVLVVSVTAALLLTRAVGRPVLRLTGAMSAIGSSGVDTAGSLGRSPILEIDRANRAFNGMLVGLKERGLMRDILGTYIPEGVVEEMLSAEGTLEPRSAEASVLFVDLAGFTTICEGMEPTAIIDMLNGYFSVAVEILERHQGVVTQFQGDAILAVFNVPVPAARHASNAVHTGLELLAAVDARTFAGRRLDVRVGIATGQLVAGSVGAADRRSYTVHGDVVNLAARLEQMNKQAGTRILVDEVSAAQADDLTFRRIGTLDVRGKTRPVTVFTPGA